MMTEQIDEPVEGGTSPYDEKPVEDGVGYHDPEATELDKSGPE